MHADRLLLRVPAPFLRPLLRADHGLAIAHAARGQEPFIQARADAPTP